ncbi:unnamed protein product [Brachionus calyciflorus]|uniref:15-oxoprostaglandin 13-reductase n=1 Tax=Brachionus calyciflorus TaxID=104777 RepID=A0A813MAA0_9BILA|nr:unnamed protein product [Brachionus calyciflorus]
MKGKKYILSKAFSGQANDDNFQLVEFDLPDELKEGEVLCQAVYLSVDPYMRLFPNTEGSPVIGEQLAEVIKTRNGEFPLATLVLTKAGWQSHFISNGEGLNPIRFDLGATPISYTLGALGMPGATAYFGLKKCDPKPNEIICVSAAAGAVGSLVGQLAKIQGLTVIGFVGSEDKLNWCKELGFDHVFNYKSSNFGEALSQVAPNGVDIYFDNVGGDYYHTIINKHMRKGGRVLVCGSIQTYQDKDTRKYDATNVSVLMNELSIYGFMCYSYYEQWPIAFTEMNKLIQEGRLKVKEQVYTGFENMKEAFLGLFKGDNVGKAVVKTVNSFTHYP